MNLTKLSAYDYDLPKELIAQKAHEPADECKLLYCKVKNNDVELKDLIFKDILDLIDKNDVLFFNNSKVVKARIWGQMKKSDEADEVKFLIVKNGEEKECRNCEILFLKKVNETGWENQMRSDESKNTYAELTLASEKKDSEKELKMGSGWHTLQTRSPKSPPNLQISTFEALVRPWKKLKPGTKVKILADKEYWFEILDYTDEWRLIKYLWSEDIFDVLEKIGKMPLPPYIEYSKDKEKPYQPVQAKKAGSVAAPTASLHFTSELFEKLKQKGVQILESTLHIWMWTFKTVDVEDITNYDIHEEMVEIPLNIFEKIWSLKQQWKNIIAVGTTATRILESLPYLWVEVRREVRRGQKSYEFWERLVKNISEKQVKKFIPSQPIISNWQITFDTKLYIYPGFEYKIVDKLITNFHLPKSSLLMLVSAFMWYENMKKAYQHAIENKYRFFSFGDAMFIEKNRESELKIF